jgi:hypothetical protein
VFQLSPQVISPMSYPMGQTHCRAANNLYGADETTLLETELSLCSSVQLNTAPCPEQTNPVSSLTRDLVRTNLIRRVNVTQGLFHCSETKADTEKRVQLASNQRQHSSRSLTGTASFRMFLIYILPAILLKRLSYPCNRPWRPIGL